MLRSPIGCDSTRTSSAWTCSSIAPAALAAAANTAEALAALKRGAIAVNIGALTEPLAIQPIRFMTARLQFCGSNWFTTGEGQSMAEMAKVGMLDLTKLVTRAYPLTK